MINYYKSYIDKNGFIHSVDMVKVFYDCRSSIENILESFREIKEKGVISDSAYWEKLDCTPCAKWNYWLHHIHFDYIYVRIGQYRLKEPDGSKGTSKDYCALACVSLEVNPNKHSDKELFKAVMEVVDAYNVGGYVMQVDYAIDVPCRIDDIVVLKTRKELGLYKGTRYYGARGQNGFVKIYNKTVESGLDYPLTRVETCVKLKDKFSSIDFGVVKHDNTAGDKELSLSTGLMLDMIQELRLLGSNNVDSYLARMNYRTRKQVIEAMNNDVVEYQYNAEYLNQLVKDIEILMHCEISNNYNQESVDEDGFMQMDDDYKLPWEL